MSWEQQGPGGPQDEVARSQDPGGAAGIARPAGDLPVIATGPAHSALPVTPLPRVVGHADGDAERSFIGVFGNVRRSGRWRLAAQASVALAFGDAILDLREAEFESATTDVRVYGAFGDLKIIVPPGVDVQVQGLMVFGDQKVERRGPAQPGAPKVIVRAYGAFGDVRIKTLEIGEQEPSLWQRIRGRRRR